MRRRWPRPDIVIRPLDKKNLARDLDIVISIFNDAWSDNWGFVPLTREEIAALGNNLKMLVTGEYIAIAEYRGEPAAMAVTLPNINDWIAGPQWQAAALRLGKARLAPASPNRPASVRMPLMGVRKQYHGTLVGSALALAVIDTVRRYQSRAAPSAANCRGSSRTTCRCAA